MLVTLVRVVLLAPHCHSLKERRAVVRKIVDRGMSRHKLAISDVGGQDSWQRIELGFAVVGSDGRVCESKADEVIRMIDELDLARRVELERDQIQFGVDY